MSRRDEIRSEIASVYEEGAKLAQELQKNKSADIHYAYQEWYTKALRAITALAPDRLSEFRGYYEVDPKRKVLSYGTYTIQDFLKAVAPRIADFDAPNQALVCFYNQLTIFKAVIESADSLLSDIQGVLYANLQDSEVKTARQLAKVNLRAAGALVGVVIEGYLQNVASVHDIKIAKQNPTIADLNDPLKAASVIDLPTWRKISYLADIRNLCSHKKDREPTADEVDELIQGAEWLTKNVF
jgi:hypothetical protein